MSETKTNVDCSFCGKNSTEVKKLIEGPGLFICDECVDLCYGIINDPKPVEPQDSDLLVEDDEDSLPTPRKIKNHLDQYVIGQDEAKMAIAVAVYNHYKRIEYPVIDGVEIDKSNILMLGPTGSGKTLIAQTIARMLDVPLAIADATTLTEAGYVGDEVDSVITRLMQAARYNAKAAERGIIFIDEIDKKRTGGPGGGSSRDVSGEGVQQALLKLLEGTDVMVPAGGKKGPGAELIKVSTKNILFILGGAFVGLEKHVEKAMTATGGNIGFSSATVGKPKFTATELLSNLQPDHLVKYGMIPELIGRLPVYAVLEELTEDQLVSILTEPKNALVRQFAATFSMDDIELEFTPEALHAVAKIAKDRKTGARGLRSVVEQKLKHTQFELPELAESGVYKVVVNADVINGSAQPERVIMPYAEDDDEGNLAETFSELLPDAEVNLNEKTAD